MRIALLGDIAPIGSFSVINWSSADWHKLSVVSDYLHTFDYVIGNLECPFSIERKKYGAKSAYLCCGVENIKLLKLLNIRYLNISNNHMFDYGEEGYELTKRILDENEIAWFGAEGKTERIEDSDNSLILDGFCCYSTNPQKVVKYGKYGLNEFDIDNVRDKLHEYRKNNLFPIISVHAGIEHVNYPDEKNIIVARQFAEICPYIYYGHHPHVLQGIELYNNSLIAHSLGNFIFDDIYKDSGLCQYKLTENNRSSCILEIEIENNSITSYKVIPISIGKGYIDFPEKPSVSFDNFNYTSLIHNVDRYNTKRKSCIIETSLRRKIARNYEWYINHFRLKYACLIFTNQINRHNFKKHFLKKVNDHGYKL